MLIYEKLVNGVRKLFGTKANVPSESDVQLAYKKEDGTAVELTVKSQLKDDGHGGMKLDGERVVAWMGSESVIPKGEVAVTSIAWTTEPTKKNYTAGDALTLAGAVITATYNDASTKVVTDECTFTPANGATLTVDNDKVTASFGGKTADQVITVVAPVAKMPKFNSKEAKATEVAEEK